jgi:hypothetical protein
MNIAVSYPSEGRATTAFLFPVLLALPLFAILLARANYARINT